MFSDTVLPRRFAPRFLAGASLAAALLLSACATPTPYQPLTRGTQASGGYSEQRLEENRFRVTFRGNSLTSREQVENYLLFRAAELTLQAGYDGFTMVTRATDPRTRTSVSSYGPYGPGPWGYWGPSWRYHGGYGWRHWDPWGPDPFWADSVDVRTVTSFEASAEIVMFRGRRATDPQSFDARQVIANLGPRISYPRDTR
jgi:hypothetical protein